MQIKVKPTEQHPTLATIGVYVKGIDFQSQCAFFEIFWEDSEAKHLRLPQGLCMEGSDYASWTDDLPYVKTWILAQTGLEEA